MYDLGGEKRKCSKTDLGWKKICISTVECKPELKCVTQGTSRMCKK